MKSGNQDKAEGTGKTMKGSVEKAAGKATNDRELEAKGKKDKAEGHGQKAVGDAKKSVGR